MIILSVSANISILSAYATYNQGFNLQKSPKAISLGIEYRFGSTKMNILSMDPDDLGYDDMEDIGGVGDVIGEIFSSAEKTKYKLKDLRLYLSFRF